MVIYNYSSLTHIFCRSLLLANTLTTLSPRHKTITFLALFSISIFSHCVRLIGIKASHFNDFVCFVESKFLASSLFKIQNYSLKNLLISHLQFMVFSCKLRPTDPWWTPLILK